jgi:hypothetical protein
VPPSSADGTQWASGKAVLCGFLVNAELSRGARVSGFAHQHAPSSDDYGGHQLASAVDGING